ncbi:choice-of-anchor A family protein [Hyalangium gracile]|uniref:choice-of-anchor A family protein n=1 Tax=Hyalangium gracile TaxID=394092 RepID=UPI001CCFA264|nr:choice-of-anchor A family protein [Hyalangium gracile]
MKIKSLGRALLCVVALAAAACGVTPGETAAQPNVNARRQGVNSTNKVLILGSSVSGGLSSREALAVAAAAPTAQIDVVTPVQWRAMTAEQFMAYRALIIGDAGCHSGPAAFEAAVQTRDTWGAIVDGDVVIVSTDPTTNHTPELVENSIKFVLNSEQKRTGMYISLGCAYQNTRNPTAVTLLEPFGGFQVQGVPDCADRAHLLKMNGDRLSESTTDTELIGSGCAARSVFTRYPERTFSFAAVAMSASGWPIPGQRRYTDYLVNPETETQYLGTPYVLVRGAMPVAAGCGLAACSATRECDLGDLLNGQPAVANQAPHETCSYSCHLNWCGDGQVNPEFGEECDNGIHNGRSTQGSGEIGTCSSFCKLTELPETPAQAPVALCRDVTVVAEYSCSEYANIDNGSYDPDNDLVGCTQSEPGPYGAGNTQVTLTCTDAAGHSSSCVGTVTVVDHVAPTVTLNGPDSEYVECVASGHYADPGATATDICQGALPANRTGSVDMSFPAAYALSYTATDASGNVSLPVSRTVTVEDTLAPQLQVRPGPSYLECNGAPYVDPGATASDQCSGDLSASIVTTSNLDQSQAGQYTVTYRVTDNAGHQSTAVRQLTVGPCSSEGCINLSLGDYNLFLREDYHGGHDVVGKVAVGGNVSFTHFAVGSGLAQTDIANTLVVGGNLTLKHGAVWGDAWYGGNYKADSTVIYPRGTVRKGTPIDFAARFAELNALSLQLAAMPINGSTVRTPWGGILLSGTSTHVNVFDVDASAFNGAKLFSIEAPAGSLVVVNIRGASAHFNGFGIHFSGGIDQHGVLFNFFEATRINAHGFGFWGTVLAPSADITFNDGSWDGGIYAKSLNGNAEGHINPLGDRNLCDDNH